MKLSDEEMKKKKLYEKSPAEYREYIKTKIIPNNKYTCINDNKLPLFIGNPFMVNRWTTSYRRPDIMYNDNLYTFYTNVDKYSWRMIMYLSKNYCICDNAVDSRRRPVKYLYAIYKIKK